MVCTKGTLEESIKSLGVGGTLVLVGVPRGFSSLDFELFRLIGDELILTGCRCATRQEVRESLELVRRGVIKPAVMNTFPLEEANEVQELIDNMKLRGRTAFVFE